ncbi:MAG: hypothetical protein IJO61_06380, partial [Oscillospiraceae bacterium]|nr:hypothetical protein [Oscillospiraceae bacterium]
IDLSGIDREYKIVKYVIDKNHANCYTKFLELGEPQDAPEDVQAIIRGAGTLKAEECGTVSPDNTIFNLKMENNAVVLLELFPA